MDFAPYDVRGYPTLPVREGYRAWAETYEGTVCDEMDLRPLGRLSRVDWGAARAAIDLACGTGRIGVWLGARGVGAIDGIDFTPEMLERARAKGVYRRLERADVAATGLPAGAYELCTMVLADEHLADLGPVYREAARLASTRATFVVVGYHPFFLLSGIPTHFDRAPGDSVAIRSYVHLLSDHVKAAHAAGWTLAEMDENLVDDEWVAARPRWAKHHRRPISFALVWTRDAGTAPR